jgi:hypothetical protein
LAGSATVADVSAASLLAIGSASAIVAVACPSDLDAAGPRHTPDRRPVPILMSHVASAQAACEG